MTTTFTRSDDLKGALFVDTNLRGARFVRADLSGAVMRGVDVQGADIDAPWLFDGESHLLVNGIDVTPYVDTELNRRFPGRADRNAGDPDGLRAAWARLEQTWAATLEQPYHPIGQPNAEYGPDGHDMSVFTADEPSYADVLAVRAGRVASVRDFLATVTPDDLVAARANPWAPEYPETTLSWLHTILGEEWEHHRYAVRDLDAIEAMSDT